MSRFKADKKMKYYISEYSLVIMLVVLCAFFGIITPNFFTSVNLTNILIQNVHVVVISIAVMIIMVSGGTDLSIGYQVSLLAVMMTKLMTATEIPVAVILLLVVLTAVLIGAVNGFSAIMLKSHPMMITLGTMYIYRGLSYLVSESKTFYYLPKSFLIIGQGQIGVVPVNVIIMVIIIIIVGIIMSKSYLGRRVYLVGDNPEASRLGGLKVEKIKVLSFACAGILVGIGAILLVSRAGAADSTTGVGLEFTGIISCVLGGVALQGGVGKLWKVVVAAFVLGVLANGMQLIGLGTYPQYIAKGLIMLFSIYLSNK